MSSQSNPYQSPQSNRFGMESDVMAWNDATTVAVRKTMMARRIIWFALLQGIIVYLFIVLFQTFGDPNEGEAGGASPLLILSRVLFPVALAIGVILDWTNFGLSFFRGKPIPNAQNPEIDPDVMGCNQALQSRDIISLAVREGVAFLALISTLQIKSNETLIYAALLIVSMAASFPRFSRVRQCITTILSNNK